MSPDNSGLWATLLLWLSGHRTEWEHAGVAGMFSLLRSTPARSRTRRPGSPGANPPTQKSYFTPNAPVVSE